MNGYKLNVREIDIYDGDTIKIISNHINNTYYIYTLRLSGIDTCEITSKNPIIKKFAYLARNRLVELITDIIILNSTLNITKKDIKEILLENIFTVTIECGKFDKYGRILAKIYNRKGLLNDILLKEKLAMPYNGNSKLTENEIINYFSN
jgi:endonuclease YncB( thermonuclease family)